MELKYNSAAIKDILNEVTICTQLFCTKNGEIYSTSAEEFLEWINEYTKYIIPEKVDTWKKVTRKCIYSPLVLKHDIEITKPIQRLIESREYAIIDNLFNFIDAGEIMKTFDETKSWDEVYKVLQEQGHSGWTFSGVLNVMINFSSLGVEFVDRYAPYKLDRDEGCKELYEEMKDYNNKRNELNYRLVKVLKKRIDIDKK